MKNLLLILAVPLLSWSASAFQPPLLGRSSSRLQAAADVENDDAAVQWALFKKHHAKGSYKGIWTTYDYIGDVSLETVASVNLDVAADDSKVDVSHTIITGATRSDCATCFDSMDSQTIPVATYTPENLDARKTRFGACGMVVGPSLLRSGAMATEMVLSHGDGRFRVILQHAPVWAKGVEPGSCPPQGLKLFRTMISRECLRDTAPTAETEAANPPASGNPVFHRPVPPFDWHKKWAGTSWTWGPDAGNRGWSLDDLEDGDAWHGSAPVELWNLRLPGGLYVQTPRVIVGGETAVCRIAWLPDSDTLLRLEAGVLALQPMFLDDDSVVGFEPPTLASLRCDVMKKMGDLEGAPSFVEDSRLEEAKKSGKEPSTEANTPMQEGADKPSTVSPKHSDGESGLQAIRDALQL